MKKIDDIIIVSLFGRGHWLAFELASHGLKVNLVDVTPSMGRWTPEDWEGPFGFFHANFLSPSQLARLSEEDYFEDVDSGFTIWLPEGPIDFKGPLINHFIEAYGLKGDIENYILIYHAEEPQKLNKLKEKISKKSFKDNWLVHLAHQWASPVYTGNSLGIKQARPLPLFANYKLRRITRMGLKKSIDWCEKHGVHVFKEAKPIDFNQDQNKNFNLEIKGPVSKALQAYNLIWMLSSEESCRFPVGSVLFPKGFIQSTWMWIRYRVEIKAEEPYKILPSQFLMIQNLHLPWTHTNMCQVLKTEQEGSQFDVWLRLPTHKRFHREYLSLKGQEVCEIFNQRIPGAKATVLDMPQDFSYDQDELGAPRFPVFEQETLKQLKVLKQKNLYFDSPETWETLDWTGQFLSQEKILSSIHSWHDEKVRLDQKHAEKGGPA